MLKLQEEYLIKQIYRLLLKRFGTQGWWPTTSQGENSPSYHSVPRTAGLCEAEKFEICVGALLTQNTAWTNVEKALFQLNYAKVLTPKKISEISFQKLARLIHSSGYFRQKAKRLKFFAKYLEKRYSGKTGRLLEKPLAEAREELLSLHGMGPETVDSILLYAGGHPVFVVDAYTKRIGQRLGLFKTEKYSEAQSYFHEHLRRSAALYNETHALLVRLGKYFCRPKPLCEKCPLLKICKTGQENIEPR